ncbi:hypothetical protein T484DRAFT_1615203, partial [Baffinella frigidus]
GSGFRVQGSGFRVQGSGYTGFRVQGLGFRVQGSGFRVQGLGSGLSPASTAVGSVWVIQSGYPTAVLTGTASHCLVRQCEPASHCLVTLPRTVT